jgi:hypothetical protein
VSSPTTDENDFVSPLDLVRCLRSDLIGLEAEREQKLRRASDIEIIAEPEENW